MLGWLTGKGDAQRTAEELYGRVVAAARQPEFYRDLGVADTTEGRFEMIALHLFLALEALRRQHAAPDADDDAVSRKTIEAFVTDMDDSMREMGVGDLTVPKKVKRAAAGFYQRSADYRAALGLPDDAALLAALNEHVWMGAGLSDQAAALAAYARSAAQSLAGANAHDIFLPGAVAQLIPIPERS